MLWRNLSVTSDYHRVHTPIRGHLLKHATYPATCSRSMRRRLIGLTASARNECLACFFETDPGWQSLVGAMIVAGISTVWGLIQPGAGYDSARGRDEPSGARSGNGALFLAPPLCWSLKPRPRGSMRQDAGIRSALVGRRSLLLLACDRRPSADSSHRCGCIRYPPSASAAIGFSGMLAIPEATLSQVGPELPGNLSTASQTWLTEIRGG